jgi:4-hydroxybenzoate polyprenyltransferase
MIETIVWAVILGAISVVGLWAAGSMKPWGWLVCLCGQAVWTAYVFSMKRYEMIPNIFIFGGLYARNWIHARKLAEVKK